jgi:polyhydroxybutyrate depolymerase
MVTIVTMALVCAPASAAEPCSPEAFEWGGKTRGYIMCVPDPVPEDPMPVVLGFHGGGGNAGGWMRRTGFHEHGTEHGYVTVYMQGCRTGLDDCSDTAGRYLWNIEKPGRPSPIDDKGYTREVLRRLEVEHGLAVDSTRIYATGHSLGGIFIYSLACDHPGLLAAIGPISAPPTDGSCTPRREGVSVFHIHGTADPNVPFDTGCCSSAQKNPDHAQHLPACKSLPQCRNPINWWPPVRTGAHPFAKVSGLDDFARIGLGCSNEWHVTKETRDTTCSAYLGCNNGAEAEVCLLENIGHSLADINRAFDVPDHLWSRFEKHSRPAPKQPQQ